MSIKMFAAIAIGSTVTEMKIFEFGGRKPMREIECVSARLNIGLDAYSMGHISSAKIEDLCEVLNDFRRTMQLLRLIRPLRNRLPARRTVVLW